jgi:hypothetical protein
VRPLSIIIFNKIKPQVANSTKVYDIRRLTKNAQVRKIKEVRSSVGLVLMKDLALMIVQVTGKQIQSLKKGIKAFS